MNCVEFERGLPDFVDGSPTPEQQVHLNSCPACSGLLQDLSTIASQAKLLAAVDDPSPAVWDALEARLRSEGLIRRSEPNYLPFRPSIWQRWRASWLVPVAAALAIIAGVKLYHPTGVGNDSTVAKQVPASVLEKTSSTIRSKAPLSHDDQQWLKTVANRPPAQLAKFQADLDQANAFIEDAQESLQRDPNDFYMQQMLINAYEQKQMLYELAVDNSGQ